MFGILEIKRFHLNYTTRRDTLILEKEASGAEVSDGERGTEERFFGFASEGHTDQRSYSHSSME
jgi:hypothetical protein